MPELNPLSNEQIFLKKIAENTGSDYNTGDVSEINPLTIDQILLKEIAANTAGLSGDITELEGKVADNTSAIEAIVNVTGAKNLLPYPYKATTKTVNNVAFVDNGNGTITVNTVNGPCSAWTFFELQTPLSGLSYGDYKINGVPSGGGSSTYSIFAITEGGTTIYNYEGDTDITIDNSNKSINLYIGVPQGSVISTPITFKPMIRDARITDPTYVPYSMTNRELTDAVNRGSVSVTADGVKTYTGLLNELFALIDANKLSQKSRLLLGNAYVSVAQITNNYLVFDGIVDFLVTGKIFAYCIYLSAANSVFMETETSETQTLFTNNSSTVAPSGQVIRIYY